jgi:hypothetical protein
VIISENGSGVAVWPAYVSTTSEFLLTIDTLATMFRAACSRLRVLRLG